MNTLFAIVMALGLLATAAFAQPTVTQVSNAASEALPPLQNSSIAQGSYFSIYGNGLAAALSTCGAGYANCLWPPSYPLPTEIQGTKVSVTVGGTTVQPYIEFAAQLTTTLAQINAVLPSNTPVGDGNLTVTYNGSTSASFPIAVVAASPGTFAINNAGTGPGAITDINFNILTPFHTAKPGDYVRLFGTGLGPAPDVSTEGTAAPAQFTLCPVNFTSCPVTVYVGGQQATIYAAGRSGYTAEDEIVFQVPQGVTGCYVGVAVESTGSSSVIGNFTSMPVDPAGATCKDADGFDYSVIQAAVTANGSANVGMIDLLSNYLNLSVLGASFQWDNDTVSGEVGNFTNAVLDGFQGFALVPSVNNCTVLPFLQYPPPPDPELDYMTFLDAGTSLSIMGPDGTQSVSNPKGNGYSQLVGGSTIAELLSGGGSAPFYLSDTGWGTSSWSYSINSGSYTVSGPGGSKVGSFSGAVPVSSAAASFKWTNSSIVSSPISRSSGLTINWTGGDPSGYVDITLVGSTLQSGLTPSATTPGIFVECIAPASAGTFTVPAYVMQSLPSTVSSTAAVPPGEILVGPASALIPITPTPSGLDALYALFHFIAGANVNWQ